MCTYAPCGKSWQVYGGKIWVHTRNRRPRTILGKACRQYICKVRCVDMGAGGTLPSCWRCAHFPCCKWVSSFSLALFGKVFVAQAPTESTWVRGFMKDAKCMTPVQITECIVAQPLTTCSSSCAVCTQRPVHCGRLPACGIYRRCWPKSCSWHWCVQKWGRAKTGRLVHDRTHAA